MIVDGLCRKCNATFDAHWHKMPINDRKCPWCGAKGKDLYITTDEEFDYESEKISCDDVGNEDNDNG